MASTMHDAGVVFAAYVEEPGPFEKRKVPIE